MLCCTLPICSNSFYVPQHTKFIGIKCISLILLHVLVSFLYLYSAINFETIGMKEEAMSLYLSKFKYTPETWARLISNPEDRRKAAQTYIESVGGKLHGFWYAFGSDDGFTLWEAPDNVSMAAVTLAITGGGAMSSFETTVLLTVEETINALRKANKISYKAPGKK